MVNYWKVGYRYMVDIVILSVDLVDIVILTVDLVDLVKSNDSRPFDDDDDNYVPIWGPIHTLRLVTNSTH